MIRHGSEAGCLRVAGLSVLERLIVAAHRAGCQPIRLLLEAPLPRFRRVPDLAIAWETMEAGEEVKGPALVAASHVLVTTDELRQLLRLGGNLESARCERLPVGVLPEGATRDAGEDLEGPIGIRGKVCALVSNEATRRSAEAGLWRSLTSSSDGWVDVHVNRPVGRWLSKILVHTPISPNQVSVVSILIGVLSGACFALGDATWAILAACLLQISAIIDCVDGDLARVLFKESKWGKWLDLVGDQVVHVSVFAGIPIGLYRQGFDAPWLALGLSSGIGVLLSFGAVVRATSFLRRRRSALLERFMGATTNRDFSVLLLVLAPLEALEVFVWVAAVGIHVFWVTLLGLQFGVTRGESRRGDVPS